MRSNRARTAPRLVRRCPIAVLLLTAVVVGAAPVQEARAAAVPQPKVSKVVIENGLSQSVKYLVEGGSPRLQALFRTLQWAENEVTVVEQLQFLKVDIVANERRSEAARAYPQAGFGGFVRKGIPDESSLRVGLSGVLTGEATPEAAQQIIGLLEQAQTDLVEQVKLLSPEEQWAAQDYVAALGAKVDALPRPQNDAPGPQPGDSNRVPAPGPGVSVTGLKDVGPANTPLAGVIPARAQVNGKYAQLLRKIEVPQDWETYGDFTDYGYYQATDWAGYKNLPAGYWVYVYPSWYIWGALKQK